MDLFILLIGAYNVFLELNSLGENTVCKYLYHALIWKRSNASRKKGRYLLEGSIKTELGSYTQTTSQVGVQSQREF